MCISGNPTLPNFLDEFYHFFFHVFSKKSRWYWDKIFIHSTLFISSLLTMTNPNQLCDVLLFVCSKMADETNLSSKLPVADRTREV